MAKMNSTTQNTFITIRCVTPSAHLTASLLSTILTQLVDQFFWGAGHSASLFSMAANP